MTGSTRPIPTQPLFGSETGSTVSTRGIYTSEKWDRYHGDQTKGYVSAYDVNAPPWAQTAEDAWQPIADRPFVAGGFVWTGFDYKGEPTPFGWPCINSHFGILDQCGFPKDNYYYYQAVWGDKPIVHVLPHWNWAGQEGQPIDVWAYSNAARVELFLNGAESGRERHAPQPAISTGLFLTRRGRWKRGAMTTPAKSSRPTKLRRPALPPLCG